MMEGIMSKTKGWKRVYIWLFFTTPFMLFIMEEAVQTLGFGRYTLTQGELWEETYEAIKIDKKINKFCLIVSIASFPLNPLAGGVFSLYFIADRHKLGREVVRIENELWGYSENEIPGEIEIFNVVSRIGVRKLGLVVIGAMLIVVFITQLSSSVRLPPARKEVMQWTESDLREAVSKIGINENDFIDFCTQNKIPVSGKGEK